MKQLKYILLFIAAIITTISCSDDSTSSSKDTSYQLYPDGYFSAGYREDYTLSGLSDMGFTFNGTYSLVAQQSKQFNQTQVIPVQIIQEWQDQFGNMFSSLDNTNYSTNLNTLQIVGFENLINNTSQFLTNQTTIPETAEIGDAGILGRYQDNFGNNTTYSWALESADNNKAAFVFSTLSQDQSGTVFLEGNTTWIIDKTGNRQSITILFDFKALNDPVRWQGTK